jgi:hypothetical protein
LTTRRRAGRRAARRPWTDNAGRPRGSGSGGSRERGARGEGKRGNGGLTPHHSHNVLALPPQRRWRGRAQPPAAAGARALCCILQSHSKRNCKREALRSARSLSASAAQGCIALHAVRWRRTRRA